MRERIVRAESGSSAPSSSATGAPKMADEAARELFRLADRASVERIQVPAAEVRASDDEVPRQTDARQAQPREAPHLERQDRERDRHRPGAARARGRPRSSTARRRTRRRRGSPPPRRARGRRPGRSPCSIRPDARRELRDFPPRRVEVLRRIDQDAKRAGPPRRGPGSDSAASERQRRRRSGSAATLVSSSRRAMATPSRSGTITDRNSCEREERAVEVPDALGRGVADRGIDDLARPEHVVGEQIAAPAHARRRGLQSGRVAVLVHVDEDHVEVSGRRLERARRRRPTRIATRSASSMRSR